MLPSRKADVKAARRDDPNGRTCHFCSRPNDLADDCGFWYILDPHEPERRDKIGCLVNQTYPTCHACYNKHSHYHIRYYGLGDR